MDFDPRDYDARDRTDEDQARNLGRGPGSSDRDEAGESGVRHVRIRDGQSEIVTFAAAIQVTP
jgi:hypothetical protein